MLHQKYPLIFPLGKVNPRFMIGSDNHKRISMFLCIIQHRPTVSSKSSTSWTTCAASLSWLAQSIWDPSCTIRKNPFYYCRTSIAAIVASGNIFPRSGMAVLIFVNKPASLPDFTAFISYCISNLVILSFKFIDQISVIRSFFKILTATSTKHLYRFSNNRLQFLRTYFGRPHGNKRSRRGMSDCTSRNNSGS